MSPHNQNNNVVREAFATVGEQISETLSPDMFTHLGAVEADVAAHAELAILTPAEGIHRVVLGQHQAMPGSRRRTLHSQPSTHLQS